MGTRPGHPRPVRLAAGITASGWSRLRPLGVHTLSTWLRSLRLTSRRLAPFQLRANRGRSASSHSNTTGVGAGDGS